MNDSMQQLLEAVEPLHRGINVYHTRDDCVAALRLMERHGFAWWSAECSAFVEQVAGVELVPDELRRTAPGQRSPLIVVEGLDGVGKTTVTNQLVARLGGTLVRTPDPTLEPLRALFRGLPQPLSRAFYCGANYLAAPVMAGLSADGVPVVVDRWWCSTCAMSLAESAGDPRLLPAPGSEVYAWPRDLPAFDVGVLLFVEERVRRLRMQKRNDENAEEARLAAEGALRSAAMQAYRRFGTLSLVEVPNYGVCVNDILCVVRARGFDVPASAYFTPEELDGIAPY